MCMPLALLRHPPIQHRLLVRPRMADLLQQLLSPRAFHAAAQAIKSAFYLQHPGMTGRPCLKQSGVGKPCHVPQDRPLPVSW